MSLLNDPAYVAEQYRDNRNLDARIALHQRFSTAPRDFHLWVFDHLDLRDDARVLELGCGTGALWAKNRHRIHVAWHLTLSDFSFGMLQAARSGRVPARFLQLDAQSIPFRDESFDAVVADHMLYHIADLPRALSEVRRTLRVGGNLYAATNGEAHLREYHEFIEELSGEKSLFAQKHFTLESGAAELGKYFSNINRFDFEDSLVVTEAEPLVAYALSGFVGEKMLEQGREAELRRAVAERIARDGAFRITKATGLFVASKGKS